MAKKNSNRVSKSDYIGLERVKNEEGNRVWRYKGKDFNSKRELDMVMNPTKYFGGNIRFTPAPAVENAVDVSGDVTDVGSINYDEMPQSE